jgi:hypothetical protein
MILTRVKFTCPKVCLNFLSALWNSANLPLQMEIAHQKEPRATFHPLGIAFPSQLELIPAHDCVLLSHKVVRNIPPFALFSFRAERRRESAE